MKVRPDVLQGKTKQVKTGCGSLYITLNRDDDGNLVEVRFVIGKVGSCINAMLIRESILLSLLLQADVPIQQIIKTLQKHFEGVSCDNAFKIGDKRFSSCGDYIAKEIIEELQSDLERHEEKMHDKREHK